MSPRNPRWTAKQLKSHGFESDGQKGSHFHLRHPQTGRRTTVPIHAGKIIGPGLLKTILMQAGIESTG